MNDGKQYSWEDFLANKKELNRKMKDTTISTLFLLFFILFAIRSAESLTSGTKKDPTTVLINLAAPAIVLIVWLVAVLFGKATLHPFSLPYERRKLFSAYLKGGQDIVVCEMIPSGDPSGDWWKPIDTVLPGVIYGEDTSLYALRVECKKEDVSSNQATIIQYLEKNYKNPMAFEEETFDLVMKGSLLALPYYAEIDANEIKHPLFWELLEYSPSDALPDGNKVHEGFLVDDVLYLMPNQR